MSMHRIPMTTVEHDGLVRHGLGRDIGKPSQLADVFLQGVKWGQSQEREACAAMFDQLEQQRDELLAALNSRKWPVMGYGQVAIGGGIQPDGVRALLYLDMGETRAIGADTTDLFPIGSVADASKLLACVKFKDSAAIQQTIDVLKEMQDEIAASAKGGAA